MHLFEASRDIAAPVEVLAALHERPGAFERLSPPFGPARMISDFPGRQPGDRARIRVKSPLGPWVNWEAELTEVLQGQGFTDIQTKGPFTSWRHEHRFEKVSPGKSRLTDRIEWQHPGWALTFLIEVLIRRHLQRVFAYRQRLICEDAVRHARLSGGVPMRVLVTGGTGLVGGMLVPWLRLLGHRVTVLSRRPAGEGGAFWNVEKGVVRLPQGETYDAVVHLAGENVGARWTPARKAAIRGSRVEGTRLLAEALLRAGQVPRVFASASGTGYYGLHPRADGRPWREGDEAGPDFLAQVCVDWEKAAATLASAGTRVCHIRLGVVLDPRGGALAKLSTPFYFGVGGPVGNPEAMMGWISAADAADLFAAALVDEQWSGPFNGIAGCVTQRQLAETLGRVLRRPSLLPVPSRLLRLVFGEMAEGTILADTPVEPARLRGKGWEFRHGDLETALRVMMGR